MSTVTVLSKKPPGGRCSLYLRYAETLQELLGTPSEVRYCDECASLSSPAILVVGGTPVAPADGVILSPEDIAGALADRLDEAEYSRLLQRLEATQEPWMEEWNRE